jgi:hypothetical protein
MLLSSRVCSDDPADLPILNSYFNVDSRDGGAALSARDSHEGCAEGTSKNRSPQSHGDNTKELFDRDSLKDLITAINTREPGVQKDALASRRDVAPDGLDAREDFVGMLNARGLGLKRDIQARGLLISALAWVLQKFMSLSVRHRDLTPDELAGDVINDYTSHATREPSPQQEAQARDIPDAARDGSATNKYITALLNSHDPSKRLSDDDVLGPASPASRALDDLD